MKIINILYQLHTYSFLRLLVDENHTFLINRWYDSNRFCVDQSTVSEVARVHQVISLLKTIIKEKDWIKIKLERGITVKVLKLEQCESWSEVANKSPLHNLAQRSWMVHKVIMKNIRSSGLYWTIKSIGLYKKLPY